MNWLTGWLGRRESRRRVILDRIAAKLDEIEAEMKRIGFWTDAPPDLLKEVEAGKIRSYLDAPSFELWLQCIFLPNARKAAETDTLPRDSQVGLMAFKEYDYMSVDERARQLTHLLHEFDDLIKEAGRFYWRI